ncbi:MAG: L-seryl-tRNA(Sec) selenium transferase [Dehalococcoidia bacterium]|nr:MAG: L-seryl-tRNA(Sec) selenium transferase [Dehalococcoidia bacterium]
MNTMESRFRGLPSVDRLMSEPEMVKLSVSYPHDLLVDLARQQLELERISIAAGGQVPGLTKIVKSICARVDALLSPGPRRVINASGVIIHTNLGRAPLSEEAIAAMNRVSAGYSDLEFDLDSGTRGSRNTHIEQLLCQVTGAEAGLVVINNAAALVLGLTALTKRKEVIISRGQAVEIGGGFRIPEVMRQSGAKLVEVGTTNSTNIWDFEQAIGPRTAALLRVHSSNFKIIGYTQNVTIEELVTLGLRHDLPVFDDLGSGCLLDTTRYGLDPEPMVQQSINLGVGLAFFSGDKLLGGPQAGIIVGKKHLVDKLKKHPLARAVRIDKTGLAGLAATLVNYLKGEALDKVPVWRMISAPLDEIERRATSWAQVLGSTARVVEGESMVGGGSLPGGVLPTKLVAFGGRVKKGEQNTAQLLARKLREQEPPIVGRLSGNTLLLDPRTVLPGEEKEFLQALQNAAASVLAN